jgi:hypothetical protein
MQTASFDGEILFKGGKNRLLNFQLAAAAKAS